MLYPLSYGRGEHSNSRWTPQSALGHTYPAIVPGGGPVA